ncbi:MAG TPA: Hsp20/alpha crystallin family protein [Polyangiales bacterium]|nr:Hsp20/alpha crystallin family protein [Polyangiales bacterium]
MLAGRVWPSRPAFENSWNDFDQLRREMLRLFDSSGAANTAGAGVFPPLNVTQDADNFYVRAEVPGVQANELQISAVKNRLSIAGKREIPPEHERVSWHRRERAEGTFNRTLTLPADLDTERVEARYVDGILTLKLPKAEEAKPRQIAVKT